MVRIFKGFFWITPKNIYCSALEEHAINVFSLLAENAEYDDYGNVTKEVHSSTLSMLVDFYTV